MIAVGIDAAPAPGNWKGWSMRKVVAYMLVSVDGVAENPDQFLFHFDRAHGGPTSAK